MAGKSAKDALATKVGTADKPEGLCSRRLPVLNQDLQADYICIEHAASDGKTDEFDYDARVQFGDLSDEESVHNSSREEADESDYMHANRRPLRRVSDQDGYMADPSSDVDRLATQRKGRC